MSIPVTCTTCGTRNNVPDALQGQKTECTFCFAKLKVPTGDFAPEGLTGYEIKELLGSGSMGRVFRAIQLSMEREVALKVIPKGSLNRSTDQRRFVNEVRLLARMDHPGIVSAFEAGETDEHYFLAMSYVKGQTVDKRLHESGQIAEAEAVDITLQVARALAYAWDKHHILHRDIKPSNLMLTADGQVRLMDLGISKVIGHDKTPSVTATGMVVGTPYYMSPEQAVSTHNMDRRSDIYSLGATFYEMVTGHKPFEGENPLEVMGHHRFSPLPSPRSHNASISRDCQTVLYTMMAKDMKERYQNWETLIDDLERLQQSAPLKHASAEALPQELQNDPGRTPTKRGMKPLSPTRGGPRLAAAPNARPAQPTAPPSRSGVVILLGLLILALMVVASWLVLSNKQPALSQDPSTAATDPAAPQQLPPGDDDAAGTENATRLWQTAFADAQAAYEADPTAHVEARRRFGVLASEAPNPQLAAEAEAAASQAAAALRAAIEQLVQALASDAATLAGSDGATAAVSHLLDYRGNLAAVSGPERQLQAARLLTRLRQAQLDLIRRQASFMELLDTVSSWATAGEYQAALQAWNRAAARPPLDTHPAMELLGQQLTQLNEVPSRIRQSFADAIGEEIRVTFKEGPRQIVVREIKETDIEAFDIVREGSSTVRLRKTFTAADLAPAEQVQRLGRSEEPGILLARALIVSRANRHDLALKALRQAETPLAHAIAGKIAAISGEDPAQAAQALRGLLLPFGITPEVPTATAIQQLWRARPPAQVIAEIPARLQQFRLLYGDLAPFREHQGVLHALTLVVMTRPALRLLADDDQALQLALVELRHDLPEERREQLAVITTQYGPGLDGTGVTALRNLSPLLGIPFSSLHLAGTRVAALDPLRAMPLRDLDLQESRVSDLSPLRGLPLERLVLSRTAVTSLDPLRGLPLRELSLANTQVENLEALVYSPIEMLDLSGCDNLIDIRPLARLTTLRLLILPRLDLAGLPEVLALPELKQVGTSRETLRSPEMLQRDLPPPSDRKDEDAPAAP